MINIQLTAVEQSKSDMVLVLGTRENDLKNRLVGFHVEPMAAVEACQFASRHGEFPIMEVEDREWFYVLATGERQFFRLKEKV